MKKIIALFATVLAVLVAVPSADAYLHVANARSMCQTLGPTWVNAWSQQNFNATVWTSTYGDWYIRYTDNQVAVDCAFKAAPNGQINNGPANVQAEVRALITGSDAAGSWTIVNGYPQWTYLSYMPWSNVPYCGVYNWCPQTAGF